MRLSLLTFALLALTGVFGYAFSVGDSNLTLFGAPRASLDGVLPLLSIEEAYIRGQTDRASNQALGAGSALQCSASNPCVDGSCCNSQGQCGFRDEHCKINCVADCAATAPCGQHSKDGKHTCPLNVCCSYFGFCGAADSFCRDVTDAGVSTPCQKRFGKCGAVAPPTCGSDSGMASRRVAYYEGWNTRRRPCDKVFPQNIDTTGLTHLIFSFPTIDPATFAVGPMHPDDEKLYGDFLSLKDGSQKWIGIGGWEFSDAGAMRYTWSQMATSKDNRAAFISSLQKFLDKWKFQGVDIDWEWPGAESRGGNPAIDMRNQIDLMAELRQALGSRGLSLVLPAQYEYLKNLDPKALEAQVDHFNVLSYDLHGPWDATVPGEGAFIKPHTDLQEIDTALTLFWFNDVSPSKINLGIANYGRGYTVADPSCSKYGCAWTGPSNAGECTQLQGVLSQCEIQRLIRAKNLRPEIIAGGAGVKQISFDGQWVGYDDSETLELKTGLANNRCLGGTALWAIDYASCAGGSGGPGAPLSSSDVLAPSSVASSVPAVSSVPAASSTPGASVTPSSMAPTAPAASSAPATFSGPDASSTSVSVPASSATTSVSPPAQSSREASSVSSAPASTSATKSEAGTSAVLSTAVPVEPSFGSSASVSSVSMSSVQAPQPPASSMSVSSVQEPSQSKSLASDSSFQEPSTPATSTQMPSMSLSTDSPTASSATAIIGPPAQTSRAQSTAPAASSSVAHTSSGAWTASSSQIVSTALPVVSISSTSSWQSTQPPQSSAATTVIPSRSGSASQSPSMTASQSSSTSSLSSSSSAGGSAWTSSTASSSVPVSSVSSSASGSSSQTTAEATSASQTSTAATSSSGVATSTVPSDTLSTSGVSSSWATASTITTGTTSGSTSSSAGASPSSGQSSTAASSSAQSSQSLSVTTSTVTSWFSSLSQATTTITREFSQSAEPSSGTSATSASSSQASSNVASSAPSSALSGSGISSSAATSGVSSWASTTGVSGTSLGSPSAGQTSSDVTTSNPAQTLSPSSQATTGQSSVVVSSGFQASSTIIIPIPTASTSSAGTTTKYPETTGGGSIATKSSGQGSTGIATSSISVSAIPMPTGLLREICPKCPDAAWCSSLSDKNVNELTEFPPPECLDNEWCTRCWPKPPSFNVDLCPLDCWLSDWCRPLCGPTDNLPIEPPEMGLKFKWFIIWWGKLPVKGCVPNDCKAECVAWYGLSLAIFKRPVCPCVPRTCTKDEDKENKDKKKCKLFGCGCGWMGLPIGPGCIDVKVDWPRLFPWGVFGQNPCKWFGGCKFPPGTKPPPGPPPEDDNPNDDDFGDEGCGPFGCRGYCYVEGGCEPCPPEICGGPKCTKPGGCGPKTGPDPKPEPTRKSKCEEDQKTTVTERLVSCFVDLKVEPTTIHSINYTLTETLTSACLSFEATYTGCGILGTTTTTTVSSFTTTSSSEAPMCTRAPLDLDNDEGDNEQPTRTTDGPSCTRAPLSLDDDEGDNEQPKSSEAPSCTRAPLSLDDDEGDNEQPKSSEAPACTRAPLSLDDDEGNNEMPADLSSSLSMSGTPTPSRNSSSIASSTSMPITSSLSANSSTTSSSMSMTSSTSANSSSSASRVLPPSTLSMPTTLPPWGTGIPSGTPTPGNCGECKSFFDGVANWICAPDGSDADSCARWSLAELCYGMLSPDYCKTGSCKHSACPKESPGIYSKANPAVPFTTVLSLSKTTVSVTATPTKTTMSLSASATPTCKSGGNVSPHGKWTAYLEQEINGQEAHFSWALWDENGCEAGKGSADNKQLLGADIITDIGAQHRPQEQKMGYMLHANISDSTSSSRSEMQFTISKPPAGCTEMCWARWKITNGVTSQPWQITSDCAQQCGMRKFNPTDVGCDDAINKFQYTDDTRLKKRGGYCWWRMPFEPANDDPPPPPPPITRDSIWRLEIRQQMEYTTSEIEWTLYDPNKQKAGSGWKDTSAADVVRVLIETQDRDDRPQDKMKYKMKLSVSNPRIKEKSTVTISYVDTGKLPGCRYGPGIGFVPECNPSYQTEPDDETAIAILNDCFTEYDGFQYICDRHLVTNTQMSCDPIPHAFYPKNAGFERKFACWWPHDFAPPASKAEVGGSGSVDAGGNATAGALGIEGGNTTVFGMWR